MNRWRVGQARRVAAALALMFASVGCGEADKKKWDEFWKMDQGGGSWFGRKEGDQEVWTIECNEYKGEGHRQTADRLAEALRRVPGAQAGDVRVTHGDGWSRVYYGEYPLRYVKAKTSGEGHLEGEMIVELSPEIKRDLDFVRGLAMEGQYVFFSARNVPKPSEDVGPPEWDLRRARGAYTLNVGVTYNTASLHDYKQAAIEWVKVLRQDGYEAYYYHDPEKPQTSICVGVFDESALIHMPDGTTGLSDAVQELRKREEFAYNLENGHITYRIASDTDTGQKRRIPNWSFLVKIPGHEESPR